VRRLRERLREGGAERGMTLAELIVYSAILAIVLPIAGTVLHGAIVANRDAQAVTGATAGVQAVAVSVETGVRNAAKIQRSTYANGSGVPQSELLLVRTRIAEPGTTWACQAWYYDGLAKTVVTRRIPVPDAGATAPVITRPATGAAGWTELARDVEPRARYGTSATYPPVFTASSTTTSTSTVAKVQVGLRVAAGKRQPVDLFTSITSRPQGETGSTPCF
jgi:type II secretory pathway pseudopilin PulG